MAAADALASVYARSLYELAEQAGGRDKIVEVGDELEQICELARSDKSFGEFLDSPIIDQPKRAGALRSMFSDRVTDLTLRFLLVLNNKQRLNHLDEVQTAYDQMIQEAFGRIEVDVFTPMPLDESSMGRIRDRVKEALGKDPVLHPYTDPSMIGGIRLRIGDQLIDGSVSGKLRRIKQSLLSEGGAAVRDRLDNILQEGDAA